jgi:hypothetical protein
MKQLKGYIIIAALLIVAGCGNDMGKVIQGRVVAYDKDQGTVTFIEDKSLVKGKPDYSILPPVTFKVPVDKNEMGPEPSVGQRMSLDAEKNQVKLYDLTTGQFLTIDYTPIEKKEKIEKDNKLVKDVKFPIVDKAAKTIQIYSKRQKLLVTFSVPDQYFDFPEKTWAAGDEVRIYYKDQGQAIRMMNITKTDIFKK